MRKLAFALVLLAVTVACGSPTAPTPAPTQTSTSTVAPPPTDPVGPIATPAPTPVPPVPVPPAPAHPWHFTAEVGFEHWWGQPVFPGHFELWINPGRIEAGAHGFDIQTAAPGNVYVIAGTRNVETLTIEYHGPYDGSGTWSWTYSGLAGQATGGLTRVR